MLTLVLNTITCILYKIGHYHHNHIYIITLNKIVFFFKTLWSIIGTTYAYFGMVSISIPPWSQKVGTNILYFGTYVESTRIQLGQ